MAGMEYRSDMLWELFIQKELDRKELRFVTTGTGTTSSPTEGITIPGILSSILTTRG